MPSSFTPVGRVGASFANLSLGAKGAWAVGIPLLALLAGMGVSQYFEAQTRIAEQRVQQAYEITDGLQHVSELLADSVASIRGYLLTHLPDDLEMYRKAQPALHKSLANLHRLVQGDSSALKRVDGIETQIMASLANFEKVVRETTVGGITAALPVLQGNQENTSRLRQELGSMRQEQQRELTERNERASTAAQRLGAALFVGGVTGLVGGIFSVVIFVEGIGRRVKLLQEDARRVAEGLPIIAQPMGRDEIAELGMALKNTSVLLSEQASELRAAHAELELRVEQRTAELSTVNENLRQAHEVIEAVVLSSPLAIWALDLEGNVTLCNPGAERIFGWTEDEVIGRPLPVIPPEQAAEYREWLEGFRTGKSIAGVERERRRKDGTLIAVATWTAPLRDADGQIRGTVAIDSDVSKHRQLEEQVRQSQKLEAIGRLAGGVAHDFNNLLTVISGYAEMLIAETQCTSRLGDFAHQIQQAAGRATGLTGQLLTFSRRQQSQPTTLNLNDTVLNSLKLLRRVIGEDVQVTTCLDPNLGRIKADPVHIDQVIMNLVVNARDAMAGGGTLTIETANARLDPEYAANHVGVTPGSYCVLSISDTGVGMDAETRSHMFEPFFTTKEAGKGTGLGLSIVYGIVKQNDGAIMVYSEPGMGTTFKIFMPMIEAAAKLPAGETVAEAERGTETILVCEDEEVIRDLIHAMLVRQGYRVCESGTPDQVIELLRDCDQPVHLLLTDVVLPQMSGFELARAVRGLRPDIKVIYMSGYPDHRMSGGAESAAPFIQKPFTGVDLARLVRQVLTGRAASG